jgi:hypothetical protein
MRRDGGRGRWRMADVGCMMVKGSWLKVNGSCLMFNV